MEIVVENLLLNLSKNIKELLLENSKRKPYRKSYKNNIKNPKPLFKTKKILLALNVAKDVTQKISINFLKNFKN